MYTYHQLLSNYWGLKMMNCGTYSSVVHVFDWHCEKIIVSVSTEYRWIVNFITFHSFLKEIAGDVFASGVWPLLSNSGPWKD